jgi:hypothetical protein
MYAAYRRLGSVRLGHGYAIPTPHSATFLLLLELLRNSFIATAKTSFTAGTLSGSLSCVEKWFETRGMY